MRYNLTILINANIAVSANSPEVAKAAVEKALEDAGTLWADDCVEFVVEHGEVTGVHDVEWHAIEIEGEGKDDFQTMATSP